MQPVKQLTGGAAVAIIGAWAASQFGGVEVPVEVQGAAAVVLTGIGAAIGRFGLIGAIRTLLGV